jgi:hypothetical protein
MGATVLLLKLQPNSHFIMKKKKKRKKRSTMERKKRKWPTMVNRGCHQ